MFTPLQKMIFKMTTFFGEIGIPMLVGGVSGGICVCVLAADGDKHENGLVDTRKQKKREATKTIVMVTALCVLLNLPIVCIAIAFTLKVEMSLSAIMISVDLTSSLVVLNSLFNSLIYFIRIRRMRIFAKRVIVDRLFSHFS